MSELIEPSDLLRRAGEGDGQAQGELFSQHRERLRRMIQLRLDRRLQGRIDPSDVLQESYLEFARSLADYLREPAIPFFLWLRMITGRKLQALCRKHLGTRMRDAGREVSLHQGAFPQASSVSLPNFWAGSRRRVRRPSGRSCNCAHPGGAQYHGRARSRSAGTQAFRAAHERRDGAGVGNQ